MLRRLRLCFNTHFRYYTNRNILSLQQRGAISDVFPEQSEKQILNLLNSSPQCVYAGFDPTANSLHVGNLLVIFNLLHWQRGGHQVIALVGGATGQIGDPSGKNKDRPYIEQAVIVNNLKGIESDINTIFRNHEKYFWDSKNDKLKPPIILNNASWYKEMDVIEFISKVGRYFRMGTMLLKESVQSRIQSDSGMSFTEFTYQIFQAYDWFHLFKKHNCVFQVGGSDQMGNIYAGHELISKALKKHVYGITLPLIVTEEGNKFGKSAGNAIWLNSEKTSPFSLYQFFLRTRDNDIERLLKYFTFLTLPEIENLMKDHRNKPEDKIPQKFLASFITKLVHGESGLQRAEMCSNLLYSNDIQLLSSLSANEIFASFEGAPVNNIMMEPGMTVLNLALNANCFKHENDAIRIIKAGGFFVNYQKITNTDEALTEAVHILPNKLSILRVGKRNYSIVKWI